MKYLEINLNKKVKDLFNETLNLLRKRYRMILGKCKDTLISWIGTINIVKMTILPKTLYRFNATPINILKKLFQNSYETTKYIR